MVEAIALPRRQLIRRREIERRVRVHALGALRLEGRDRLRVLHELEREVRRVDVDRAVLQAERRRRRLRLPAARRLLRPRLNRHRQDDDCHAGQEDGECTSLEGEHHAGSLMNLSIPSFPVRRLGRGRDTPGPTTWKARLSRDGEAYADHCATRRLRKHRHWERQLTACPLDRPGPHGDRRGVSGPRQPGQIAGTAAGRRRDRSTRLPAKCGVQPWSHRTSVCGGVCVSKDVTAGRGAADGLSRRRHRHPRARGEPPLQPRSVSHLRRLVPLGRPRAPR